MVAPLLRLSSTVTDRSWAGAHEEELFSPQARACDMPTGTE